MTTPNHASARSTGTPPVDDARLMMLLDRELDADEEADLERLLADHPDALSKLDSLETIGAVLRERADADTRADGIADAVMAALAEPAVHGAEASPVHQHHAGGHGQAHHHHGENGHRAASTHHHPRRHGGLDGARHHHAANDNARSIFAIAGLAAAAAAALFVWGKTLPTDGTPDDGRTPSVVAMAPMSAEMAARLEATAQTGASDAASAAVAEGTIDNAVEVASVEFGSRQGSVFYVPGDGAGTTVVWINDAGEEQ